MKIRASGNDFGSIFSLLFSIAILVSFVRAEEIEIVWIIISSTLFGMNVGNVFMRYIGWVLPEKEIE